MKERQLLLKQQEEIERMRNSTLRLKERLKSAGGEVPPVSSAVTNHLYSLYMKREIIFSKEKVHITSYQIFYWLY